MLTNESLRTIILDNFNDIRISAITLFIKRLMERKAYGDGLNRYRLSNTITNSYITSFSEFTDAIDANRLTYDYNFNGDKGESDRLSSITVVPENLIVNIDTKSGEDSIFTSRFGKYANRIMFLMNHMNDGDTVLPLKIYDIRLF